MRPSSQRCSHASITKWPVMRRGGGKSLTPNWVLRMIITALIRWVFSQITTRGGSHG